MQGQLTEAGQQEEPGLCPSLGQHASASLSHWQDCLLQPQGTLPGGRSKGWAAGTRVPWSPLRRWGSQGA